MTHEHTPLIGTKDCLVHLIQRMDALVRWTSADVEVYAQNVRASLRSKRRGYVPRFPIPGPIETARETAAPWSRIDRDLDVLQALLRVVVQAEDALYGWNIFAHIADAQERVQVVSCSVKEICRLPDSEEPRAMGERFLRFADQARLAKKAVHSVFRKVNGKIEQTPFWFGGRISRDLVNPTSPPP